MVPEHSLSRRGSEGDGMMALSEEKRRRLGTFRVVLGTAQIMAATMTLAFLLQIGATTLTYVAGGTALGRVDSYFEIRSK